MLYAFVCDESEICGICWKSWERQAESTILAEVICVTKAVDHRSLGFSSARKSTRKGKIVSLLVICGDIKRSRGHEMIPVHRTAIKTVISGRIDVGVNVTRDIRDSRFRFTWLNCGLSCFSFGFNTFNFIFSSW